MTNALKPLFLAVFLISSAAAAERTVTMDPARSRLEVNVKANVDKFTAKVSGFQADIRVDDSSRLPTAAVVRFRFDAIKTGKPDRDKEMNAWEQSGAYPDVSFTLTRITASPRGGYDAEGQVHLHGVDRPVHFPVTVALQGEKFVVDGQAALDTRDFGLPVIKKYLVLKVDPHVGVLFHVEGSLPTP